MKKRKRISMERMVDFFLQDQLHVWLNLHDASFLICDESGPQYYDSFDGPCGYVYLGEL